MVISGLRHHKLGILLLSTAWFLCEYVALASSMRPKAPHLVQRVEPNGVVDINLSGYDMDGDRLTTQITSLPSQGGLYSLNANYVKAGVEPKQGTRLTSPTLIRTDNKNRVIYAAPKNKYAFGEIARFTYTVSDGTAMSGEGVVSLVIAASPVSSSKAHLTQSDFSEGSDGWKVISNGINTDVVHEQSSYMLLNRFVHATDAKLHIDAVTGHDKTPWFFSAPAKFLGFSAHAYKGSLDFTLGAFTGDFSVAKRNPDLNLVVLECKTCNLGKGMRFAVKLADYSFDGRPKAFSIPLTESSWLKDSKNTLQAWAPPTNCEFVEMLHSLSAVNILGDFTNFYESVALDNVALVAPADKTQIPVSCLCANPGTRCSY